MCDRDLLGRLCVGIAVIAVVAAACSEGQTTPPSPAASRASASATDTSLAVHGVETCRIVDAVYEGSTDRERFHCQESSSDPRLDGEWETWFITEETGGGLGAWTGDLVMTNAGGTWRGTASGTTTGMPGNPTNLGQIVWVGEGGYAGLTYHELVYGPNGRLVTAGWIEPS